MNNTVFRDARDLSVFESIARNKSFTGAAKELKVSKQTISGQLKRLEDRLGTRLFNRSTRTLSLTDAGARIYPYCRQMVEAASNAIDGVSGMTEEPSGVLTVAATRTFGRIFLADVLFDYLEKYPNVRIDLRLEDRHFNLVEEGIDISFQVIPPTNQSHIVRNLGPALSCIVASPDFIDRSGPNMNKTTFRRQNTIEWRRLGSGNDSGAYNARLLAPSAEIAIAAAARGLGLTKAPLVLASPYLKAGTLRRVESNEPHKEGQFMAVYPATNYLSASVRHLIDLVVSTLDLKKSE